MSRVSDLILRIQTSAFILGVKFRRGKNFHHQGTKTQRKSLGGLVSWWLISSPPLRLPVCPLHLRVKIFMSALCLALHFQVSGLVFVGLSPQVSGLKFQVSSSVSSLSTHYSSLLSFRLYPSGHRRCRIQRDMLTNAYRNTSIYFT